MLAVINNLEVESLEEFQRELHRAGDDEDSDYPSNFYTTHKNSPWYSLQPTKMSCTSDGDTKLYKTNGTYNLLEHTYLRFVTPTLVIQDDYKKDTRIAWCHNLGHNIVREATFNVGADIYQSWDSEWADINSQFYQRQGAGKRESCQKMMGNRPELEDWTQDTLKSEVINVDQPWFYTNSPYLAFPIGLAGSTVTVEHRYNFRKTHELVRVQRQINEIWEDVTLDESQFLEMIRYTNKGTIHEPELWGSFALTDNRAASDISEETHLGCRYANGVDLCYLSKDVVKFQSGDISISDKATITNDIGSLMPALAFFWNAENKTATKYNNYSNYTNNCEDLYKGSDPITSTTFKYGTDVKLKEMASDHFSHTQPLYYFRSIPNEVGYHAFSVCHDSLSVDVEPGLIFKKLNAKIECKVVNSNGIGSAIINKQKADDPQTKEKPNEYSLNVHILLQRKITISKVDKNVYKFSIV